MRYLFSSLCICLSLALSFSFFRSLPLFFSARDLLVLVSLSLSFFTNFFLPSLKVGLTLASDGETSADMFDVPSISQTRATSENWPI